MRLSVDAMLCSVVILGLGFATASASAQSAPEPAKKSSRAIVVMPEGVSEGVPVAPLPPKPPAPPKAPKAPKAPAAPQAPKVSQGLTWDFGGKHATVVVGGDDMPIHGLKVQVAGSDDEDECDDCEGDDDGAACESCDADDDDSDEADEAGLFEVVMSKTDGEDGCCCCCGGCGKGGKANPKMMIMRGKHDGAKATKKADGHEGKRVIKRTIKLGGGKTATVTIETEGDGKISMGGMPGRLREVIGHPLTDHTFNIEIPKLDLGEMKIARTGPTGEFHLGGELAELKGLGPMIRAHVQDAMKEAHKTIEPKVRGILRDFHAAHGGDAPPPAAVERLREPLVERLQLRRGNPGENASGAPPVPGRATPPAMADGLRKDVDELRKQIRELERMVRELKSRFNQDRPSNR